MIGAEEFLNDCLSRGFNFFTGTPCSYLRPFINYVIDHDEFRFVDATNEGDAVAIAAGVAVAGGRPVVMFQNSGLGNAVNALTSLTYTFRIPMLIITTLRGEPKGEPDEPQHELMGQITPALLETMQLPWAFFPDEGDKVKKALDEAELLMKKENRPFVFVMRKKDVAPYELKDDGKVSAARIAPRLIQHQDSFSRPYNDRPIRTEALRVLQEASLSKQNSPCVLVATTGKTGRELYEVEDLPHQFYMVGSMGHALPFGLGLSLARPSLKTVVIDGDGALLMRMGSCATVGAYAPQNLVHVLLDNEVHDSTGGQKTVSPSVSFAALAKGFSYAHVFATDELAAFKDYLLSALRSSDGPTFIHLKIKKGSPKNLGRPGVAPEEVGRRFANFIKEHTHDHAQNHT